MATIFRSCPLTKTLLLCAEREQNMSSPHVLILPYPCQGHVIPLMELSHCLLDRGFRITFVNTEFNHARIISALSHKQVEIHNKMRLVSIPDGLDQDEDRNNLARLCGSVVKVMPGYLEEVIKRSYDEFGCDGIAWMIVDMSMAWALEVGRKMGVRMGLFWPAAAVVAATLMHIPKLVEDGIVDEVDGSPKRCEMIELIPGMPPMDSTQLPWNLAGDPNSCKILFQYFYNNIKVAQLAEFIICNSFQELESPLFTYMPALIPVGPLTTDQLSDKPLGTFWPEDEACINWLDSQPPNSVIYVASGSLTIISEQQFQELALGLEFTNRPFLWVVRPDLTNGRNDAYPVGFLDRIANRGMIVGWCPQQKVLAHSSIACFLSHCGWNSTIEGVRNGVPFLCWPHFIDQSFNQSYICDVWNIGLRMDPDESGMILREKIKEKVDELLADEGMRLRSSKWKEAANTSIIEGGYSYENFNSIVNTMKIAKPL